MATKDQERKALEQIRKIVAGLGEESYIGRAFEGCFEIAKQNIDNDFWNSPKESAETLRKNLEEAQKEIAGFNFTKNHYESIIDSLEAEKMGLNNSLDTLQKRISEEKQASTQNFNNFREQEDRAEALELENMKLKAKLYDMMVGA